MTVDQAKQRAEQALSEIDWYRRCLEDLQDRRPVRGLAEAKAGYDHGFDVLAREVERLQAIEQAARALTDSLIAAEGEPITSLLAALAVSAESTP